MENSPQHMDEYGEIFTVYMTTAYTAQ